MSWVPPARDPKHTNPWCLYPYSQCTCPSSTLHVLCTCPLVHWWLLVWELLVPCWILSLSPGGCWQLLSGCVAASAELWPPYLPVHPGLRALLHVTEQKFKICLTFLGGSLELVRVWSSWPKTPAALATFAKQSHSDGRVQLKGCS